MLILPAYAVCLPCNITTCALPTQQHQQSTFCAQVPQECPLEVEQLIDMCLATDPADRPTAKQAFDIISSCSSPAGTAQAQTQKEPASQADADAKSHAGPQQQQHGQPAVGNHQQHDFAQTRAAPQEMAHLPQSAEPLPHGLTQQQGLQHPEDPVANPMGSVQQLQAQPLVDTGQLQQSPVQSRSEGAPALPSQKVVPVPNSQQQQEPSWGYDTAAGLPTGVLGHLYPSPFAVAADASSGPLWDWQTAAVV